ncbi:MAG TPA: hypothetical protein VFC05_14890 [Nitrososphaeraceae archaeon]|nr:hypothetical protein [Nitrososphaeraceae archaeon]
MWNHTGIPAQGCIFCNTNDDFYNIKTNFIKNQQNDILPKTVRTLPNMVSFSLPMNRSTRLSYQDSNQNYNLDMTFGLVLNNTLKIIIE